MDNKILSTFYRELADSIDNDQIDEDGLKDLGEFYMSYNFYNNIEQNIEEKEFKKFLVLGWYIYSMILSNNDFENQIDS